MPGITPRNPSHILREVVRTRCPACGREVLCAIDPRTPADPERLLALVRCRAVIEQTGNLCQTPLRIVSARGVLYHSFPIGADTYDIAQLALEVGLKYDAPPPTHSGPRTRRWVH